MLRRIQSYRDWDNPDDYTVHEGETNVGRIFRRSAAHPEWPPVDVDYRFSRAAWRTTASGEHGDTRGSYGSVPPSVGCGRCKPPPWLAPDCDWVDGRPVKKQRE